MFQSIDNPTKKQFVFGLPRTPNSLIPFFTPKHTFLTSNNVVFNIITYTLFFTLFNQRKPFKNKYTRKQPTHFFMKPLNPNFLKKIFEIQKSSNLVCLNLKQK